MNNNQNDNDEQLKSLKPGPDKLVNSKQAWDARRKAAQQKQRITIRVDGDVLDEFKELAGDDGNYQTLINIALRQWLEAQGLKELLKKDLPGLVQEAVKTAKAGWVSHLNHRVDLPVQQRAEHKLAVSLCIWYIYSNLQRSPSLMFEWLVG